MIKAGKPHQAQLAKVKLQQNHLKRKRVMAMRSGFLIPRNKLRDYHYAFLQAFNKGDHEGETYEMHLYAIKDTGKAKEKYWIGRVKNLEVLTKEEAEEIVSIYKKRGWFNERLNQLREFQIGHFNFDIVAENESISLVLFINIKGIPLALSPFFILDYQNLIIHPQEAKSLNF